MNPLLPFHHRFGLPGRRVAAVAMLAFLLAAGVFAPPATAGWLKDLNTGCSVWDWGEPAHDGATWLGPCEDGKASGPGVLQFYRNKLQGDRYEGAIENGLQHGNGTLVATDGTRYDGQWQRGRRHGPGT